MAQKGIFCCLDCDHKFYACEGGLKSSEEYSCVSCDTSIFIYRSELPAQVVCKKCGSEALKGLKRMCPACRSRNTKITRVEVYLD